VDARHKAGHDVNIRRWHETSMSVWVLLAVNSIALGGLLFLLSAGFSLIFGLMRIPNLMHGSFFMLGAYFGVTFLDWGLNFWLAALLSGLAMAAIGGVIERFLLRRLEGQVLPQVLLTLGFAFIIADVCLMIWTGDPWQPPTPRHLQGAMQAFGIFFPLYRLVILGVAVVVAIALWLMIDWTRLGAMIRAGVDDPPIARVVGIKVSQLFTLIFCLGAALAAFAGVMGAPYLSVYPGLDFEMLPLALIVVILGGTGSLLGALLGSFLIGFLYNFGQAMFPDLAYVILFLPMLLVLVLRPQGLFGRVVA
jgi:branched-chain amino acid transport system permease protein